MNTIKSTFKAGLLTNHNVEFYHQNGLQIRSNLVFDWFCGKVSSTGYEWCRNGLVDIDQSQSKEMH